VRTGRGEGRFPVPVSRWYGRSGDVLAGRTCMPGDAAFPAPVPGCCSRRSWRVPGGGTRTGTPRRRRGGTGQSWPFISAAGGCGEDSQQPVVMFAFGVQQLLGADGAVTSGGGQMPGSLQPGPVLPVQRLPLPDRVIAGLPDLLAGIGLGLPGAGQPGLGGMNQRRSVLTGPVTFRPRRLSGSGGLRDLPGSAGLGGHGIGVSTGDRLGQLPPRLRGRLTSAAGLALGRLPAAIRSLRRFQRRKHLQLSLGGTCLGGHRARLSAAPGRFRLGQLHGHRFGIQRRGLPAGQRDQGTRLPDQRRQRAERVTGLLR